METSDEAKDNTKTEEQVEVMEDTPKPPEPDEMSSSDRPSELSVG